MALGAHKDKANIILAALADFEKDHGSLPGIASSTSRDTLVAQVISSMRRIDFIANVVASKIHPQRLDPHNVLFDPYKGASLLLRKGELDEAVWLVFLATQFGKHIVDGWKLAGNVMGSFGNGTVWTRAQYQKSQAGFEAMLLNNVSSLNDWRIAGRYSNHRQYESRKPEKIAKVFRSFDEWQGKNDGFRERLQEIHVARGQNPEEAFDGLYRSFKKVHGFGRLGAFDFLTMIGKLEIAPISPGSVYLNGATGPLSGAKLLFFGNTACNLSVSELEKKVDKMDSYLSVGKQVIEDSLCNWQKSPNLYVHFRG
ncbi:MAG: hypothetical protein V7666_03595 [Sulfitobacter sp.]|uniref:alpha-glutamyl/putrescinyl thymine pyrophosphorylase clade 3 protein n=1 Tax=Sulfitobacter sp. TaxID=1903071 RepID=UPI0030022E5F